MQARQTAELIEKYGKAAAVALSARKVSVADAGLFWRKNLSYRTSFTSWFLKLNAKYLVRGFR